MFSEIARVPRCPSPSQKGCTVLVAVTSHRLDFQTSPWSGYVSSSRKAVTAATQQRFIRVNNSTWWRCLDTGSCGFFVFCVYRAIFPHTYSLSELVHGTVDGDGCCAVPASVYWQPVPTVALTNLEVLEAVAQGCEMRAAFVAAAVIASHASMLLVC